MLTLFDSFLNEKYEYNGHDGTVSEEDGRTRNGPGKGTTESKPTDDGERTRPRSDVPRDDEPGELLEGLSWFRFQVESR